MTEVFTAQAHTQAKRWVECGPPGTGPRHPRHPGPMPPVFRRVLFYSRKQVLDLSGCCVSLRREFFSSSKRRTWSVAVGKADGGRSLTCRRRPRWTGLCSCALLSPRLSTLVWKGFFWVVEGWVEKAPQKCQRREEEGIFENWPMEPSAHISGSSQAWQVSKGVSQTKQTPTPTPGSAR